MVTERDIKQIALEIFGAGVGFVGSYVFAVFAFVYVLPEKPVYGFIMLFISFVFIHLFLKGAVKSRSELVEKFNLQNGKQQS